MKIELTTSKPETGKKSNKNQEAMIICNFDAELNKYLSEIHQKLYQYLKFDFSNEKKNIHTMISMLKKTLVYFSRTSVFLLQFWLSKLIPNIFFPHFDSKCKQIFGLALIN
jgi:hypothetical protein